MREDRLLERIRRWDKEPSRRLAEDPKRAADSVVHHLQRLLNTRQGSVPIAGDYGIPDFLHLLQRGNEGAVEMESILRDVIEKYEPRLASVQVRHVANEDGPIGLRFHVQAKLQSDKAITLETLVGPDGKVRVSN